MGQQDGLLHNYRAVNTGGEEFEGHFSGGDPL